MLQLNVALLEISRSKEVEMKADDNRVVNEASIVQEEHKRCETVKVVKKSAKKKNSKFRSLHSQEQLLHRPIS